MKNTRLRLWFATLSFCCLLATQAADVEPLAISPGYMAALRDGDVRKLRDALDHGASANARDAAGNSALMLASLYGDASCMRLLLDRGANVNATNAAGASALMRAAFDYDKPVPVSVRSGYSPETDLRSYGRRSLPLPRNARCLARISVGAPYFHRGGERRSPEYRPASFPCIQAT